MLASWYTHTQILGLSSSSLSMRYVYVYILGICNETSNTTYICQCSSEWEGRNCERRMNYCQNITCENNGICRSLSTNYMCECISNSYSGQYCEIISNTLITHQIVSKSFGYIAIIAISTVVMLIIVLDIMKYCFGIDPAEKDLSQLRRRKRMKKKTKKKSELSTIVRFNYVNPSTSNLSE